MQVYIGGRSIISETVWPGKQCLLVFFSGCNFRCPFCYASHILDFKEAFIEELKDVKKMIADLKDEVDAVIFTGGEPTLQRGVLVDLVRYTKQLGLMAGVETNGSKPSVIKELLTCEIDYVSLDLKAPMDYKIDKEMFEKVTKSGTFFISSSQIMDDIRETINLLKGDNDRAEIEFKTTVVPSLMFRKEDILAIAAELKDFDARWTLQQYRPEYVKDVRLKGLDSPTIDFMENIKQSINKEYPNLRVRISENQNPAISKDDNPEHDLRSL